MKRLDMTAEILERRDTAHAWGVEAIDERGDGGVLMAIFYGHNARARAAEYAHAKFAVVRGD